MRFTLAMNSLHLATELVYLLRRGSIKIRLRKFKTQALNYCGWMISIQLLFFAHYPGLFMYKQNNLHPWER